MTELALLGVAIISTGLLTLAFHKRSFAAVPARVRRASRRR
jgi:hypothetical protein